MFLHKIKNMGALKKRFLKGGAWVFVGNSFFSGFNFLSSVFLVRLLGLKNYGSWAIILSTVSMFELFAGLSIGLSVNRLIAEYRDDYDRIKSIIAASYVFNFLFALVLISLFFLFSPYFFRDVLSDASLKTPLKTAVFVVLFTVMVSLQSGIMSGLEGFKKDAIVRSFLGITRFIMMCLGGYLIGVRGVSLGLVLSTFLTFILGIIIIKKQKLLSLSLDRGMFIKDIKEIMEIALPYFGAGLLGLPMVWITNLWLAAQENGYEKLAIFNIITQWQIFIFYFPRLLAIVGMPILSYELNKDPSKTFSTEKKFLIINVFIGSVVIILILLFFPFMKKMYGKQVEFGYGLLSLGLLTGLCLAIRNSYDAVFLARRKVNLLLYINLVWSLCLVFLFRFVFFSYGVLGLLLSYLISHLVVVSLFVYFNQRIQKEFSFELSQTN